MSNKGSGNWIVYAVRNSELFSPILDGHFDEFCKIIEDAEIEGEEKPTIEPRELESVKKIDAMMAQLDRDHFVSYWS